jgi:hypothetical protein
MMVMTLRWSLLAKIGIATVLGNLDAIISHQIIGNVPIWFIDLYAIPIEYLIADGVIRTISKIIKRVRNARKSMQR